jgi:hypothetical protein
MFPNDETTLSKIKLKTKTSKKNLKLKNKKQKIREIYRQFYLFASLRGNIDNVLIVGGGHCHN